MLRLRWGLIHLIIINQLYLSLLVRIFLCISLTCGCSHIHVLSLSLRWHLLLRISCKYVLIKMLYAQNLRVIQINMVFGTMMYSL